jgi:YHS domain-containing protein
MEFAMSQVKDPVCGMLIDPETAAGSTTFESQEVYFCSDQCRRDFEADPGRYYDRLERQEPPYTVSEGFVAPKFGSAGSGGLEYEGAPERPRRP